jgi:hypothetical protein
MVFPESFLKRRTVRKQLKLSGRNLRDSRYEHSLIADLLLHVRGAHGDLLKNFTPQLSVKEYD